MFRRSLFYSGSILIVTLIFFFFFELTPPFNGVTEKTQVVVQKGDGLNEITDTLNDAGFIRSPLVFKWYALLTFRAHALKPGNYMFGSTFSVPQLVRELYKGGTNEIRVTIPEGKSIKEIDAILFKSGILGKGELIAANAAEKGAFEGYLFPDTYHMIFDSTTSTVITTLLNNFNVKALPQFSPKDDIYKTLVLASILEREVIGLEDKKIVAGILLKRLGSGWPLQADATICYVKPGVCHPITTLDLKIDSPYNTYLYKGLPPTPIGNPGTESIEAALHPKTSPYWFYITDPKTRKTIFARTLDEHTANRVKFLNTL